MSQANQPWVLVDGSSFLFRAYHGMPALTNAEGHPTGAIYGVVAMLKRLRSEVASPHWLVVFDTPGPNHRHALYPDYKANRSAMPDDLAVQIAPLKSLLQSLGYPLLEVPGVEADDILATLVRLGRKQGAPIYLVTGDKDLTQLVTSDVTWWNTMSDQRLDPAGVEAKFGVRPDQIADWLALVGDSSDNIPGVPGVGPKTAAKWLHSFGDLTSLCERSDDVPGKAGERLRANLDQLQLSRQLVALRDAVVLPSWQCQMQPEDTEAVRKAYQQWGFMAWLKALPQDKPALDFNTVGILTVQDWQHWRQRLMQASVVALDLETTSLDARDAAWVGVAFAIDGQCGVYLPLAHAEPGPCTASEALDFLKEMLAREDLLCVGHNLKYDLSVLHALGLPHVSCRLFDTMLAHYVLDSSVNRHDLNTLSETILGHTPVTYEAVTGTGKDQVTFDQVPLDQAIGYAGEDAVLAWRLYEVLGARLEQLPGLKQVFETLECPLIPVLVAMEMRGVAIDASLLSEQSRLLQDEIGALEARAYDLADQSFNLSSPKQLREILFERMGLPVVSKTPSGAASTAEDVLQELSHQYELPKVILRHRHLSKLKSTYTDRLPEAVHPRTGRVHCSYNQAVTATGRLSSNRPNLQNIPIRTEEGQRIRRAFVAPKGFVLVCADYSQIELRIMAHLSEDARLLEAFANDLDVHAATAAEVFAVPLDAVSSLQRRQAKAINFGLMYGMSAFGLSKQLGVTPSVAKSYVDQYFGRYVGVKAYMERTREFADAHGYVETLWGRRLYLPDIRSKQHAKRAAAQRAAINAPMQGSSADLIKQAMIDVQHRLDSNGWGAGMIMQVHDELVLEVPFEHEVACRSLVCQAMEGAGSLKVPLKVSCYTSVCWFDAGEGH